MQTHHRYYLFLALMRVGVMATATAYAPFLLSLGLTLGEIALVNAVYWFSVIAFELPTGMLADGRGRAWSLKAAACVETVGAALYFSAVGFKSAMLAEAVLALGSAFLSGAGHAWLADALTREGKKHRLRRVYAEASVVTGVLTMAAGIGGAYLASFGLRLIWLPMLVLNPIAFWFAARCMNGRGETLDPLTEWQALRASFLALRRSSALRWAVWTVVLMGAVVPFNHFWAPFFRSAFGQRGLGVVWFFVYGGMIAGGVLARRARMSGYGHIIFAVLCTGAGLILLALLGPSAAAMAPLVVHEIGRGMFEPLNAAFVQHRVQSGYRATYGSLQSFIGNSGYAVTSLLVGFALAGSMASTDTISTVWLAAGAVLMAGSAALWLLRPKKAALIGKDVQLG